MDVVDQSAHLIEEDFELVDTIHIELTNTYIVPDPRVCAVEEHTEARTTVFTTHIEVSKSIFCHIVTHILRP